MNELTNLSKYTNKIDGQSFPASEWNGFVEDVINTTIFNKACLTPGKLEKFNETTAEWEEIVPSSGGDNGFPAGTILGGGDFRASGFFNTPLFFIPAGTETDSDTTITLNNCFIKSDAGSCISYVTEDYNLNVVLKEGSENYLIQTNSDSEFETSAAIVCLKDMRVTGAGTLYIENAIGHGIRAQELELRGDVSIIANVEHDAFHATQCLDLYNGDYYILNANDAFGSGERDEGEETKLRGIIRVFGGNIHVYNVKGDVIDAKYDVMMKGSDDLWYIDALAMPAGVTEQSRKTSGFHTLHYTVDGPGMGSLISTSIVYTMPKLEDGAVTVNGEPVTPTVTQEGNNEYIIEGTVAEVTGYVIGTIIFNTQSSELQLNHAIIEAPATGDNAGVAVKYTASKKNIEIQSNSGSEGNYIFGSIVSANNVKVTPKIGSVIHIEACGVGNGQVHDGVGISGSTIAYCDGGGSIYITGCRIGSRGSEQWIGNSDNLEAGENLRGDVYAFNNLECDIEARLNSTGNKKGFFKISEDFDGNAFVGTIKPTKSYHEDIIDCTGYIGAGPINNGSLYRGKLYYQKNVGACVTTMDLAVKYTPTDCKKMISNLV